ncbi:hypothetical protein [Phenylobacterium sp.]|jgi:hypothetical protein|uniref:hypothetical protein n=1 Tax=Phenylobacterium sp. TaxID=1871053 RepID=UPI002F413A97
MDIHKPKPWHGWRELAKEVGTIVIGVLIALGGEQAVEWAHTQGEVRGTRAALRTDIGRSLRTLTLEAREDACWPGLLDAMEAWAKGAAPKPKWPGVLQQSLGGTAAWETAKNGAVPHMGQEERLTFARYYYGIENQQITVYRQVLNDLELLGYLERDSLDPQESHALIRLIGQIRANIAGESRNIPGMLAVGRGLGAGPGPKIPAYEARIDALCEAFPRPSPVTGTR